MKDLIPDWHKRLIEQKEQLKANGEIDGDIEISERVSDLLDAVGLPRVDRGAVNHWLKGRRQPNITQFVALCEALKVRPARIIDNSYDNPSGKARHIAEARAIYRPHDPEITDLIDLLAAATPETKRMAIAAAKGVLAAMPTQAAVKHAK